MKIEEKIKKNMKTNKLTPIPRIESQAPNRNTIEWEIPDKVSVCLILIEKIGHTFIAKVKIEKKYWWSSSYKTFTVSSTDVMEVIVKGLEFLEQYGYYIDHRTIEIGEVVGWGLPQGTKLYEKKRTK